MRRFVSALFVLLASVSPGRADALWTQKIAAWSASAYTRDKQFSHCAAIGSYKSGILLALSINKQFGWSMALINPAWNLRPGNQYPISFNVDLAESQSGTATAINSHMVEIALADSVELFKSFKSGKTLFIHAQAGNFQFNLTDSSKVLAFLADCAKGGGTKPQIAAANPFDRAETTGARRDNTAFRTEALTFAANLVSAMGISGVKFYEPNEIPKSMLADAAWKTLNTIGGVGVLPGAKSATEVSSTLIGAAAKACDQAFASGSLPADKGNSYPQFFTRCGSAKEALNAYYIVAPRRSGGFYLISSLSMDMGEAAATPSSDFRSAVMKVTPR